MSKINLILIGFCFSVLSSCIFDDDSQTIYSSYHTVIDGQILDEITGNPIDSAEVELSKSARSLFGFDHKILTMHTNSDGKFYFDNHCTVDERYWCSLSLDIHKKCYYPIYNYRDVEEGTENNITIYLTPWPTEFHTVATGRFFDRDTEKPIENINFYFLRNVSHPVVWDTVLVTHTDITGYFRVEDHYTRNPEEEYPEYELDMYIDGYDLSKISFRIVANDTIHYYDTYLDPL